MNAIRLKDINFKVRHGTGGNWEKYRAPVPEVAAEKYAKAFDMTTGETIEVQAFGFYTVRTEKIYRASKYQGAA